MPLNLSTKSCPNELIWSPASYVNENEKKPILFKIEEHFVKREDDSESEKLQQISEYDTFKKSFTDILRFNNNNNNSNNNNNTLSVNKNVPANFESSGVADKVLKSRKPDSSDFQVFEYRDEKGKKERSFEVKY